MLLADRITKVGQDNRLHKARAHAVAMHLSLPTPQLVSKTAARMVLAPWSSAAATSTFPTVWPLLLAVYTHSPLTLPLQLQTCVASVAQSRCWQGHCVCLCLSRTAIPAFDHRSAYMQRHRSCLSPLCLFCPCLPSAF